MKNFFLLIVCFLVMGIVPRMSVACLIADQHLRILLGTNPAGYVWMDIDVRRDGNDFTNLTEAKDSTYLWRMEYQINKFNSQGERISQQKSAVIQKQYTIDGENKLSQAMSLDMAEIIRKTKLHDFSRTQESQIYDCRGSRRCGDWALETNGADIFLKNHKTQKKQSVLKDAEAKAVLVGGDVSMTVNDISEALEALMITTLVQYKTAKGDVWVVNVGRGDRKFSYPDANSKGLIQDSGEKIPKFSKAVKRDCHFSQEQEGICYGMPMTMHHGHQYDFVFLPSNK